MAPFSSRSHFVDLAAPGDDIPVASALGQNWRSQLGYELLVADGRGSGRVGLDGAPGSRPPARWPRSSGARRRDIARAGRDQASGFGMSNVAAALALPVPIRDPFEPNDDIDEVDPNGDRYVSKERRAHDVSRRSARIAGRVDRYEDPRDVYRVWLPAGAHVTATLTRRPNGDLALYSATAKTVVGRYATDGRLAVATAKGTRERLRVRQQGQGPMGVRRREARGERPRRRRTRSSRTRNR